MLERTLRRWWLLGAAFILVFGSVGLVACDEDDEEGTTVGDIEDAGGADTEETPEVTFGETVTVDGEVGEVIGDQAFVLQGDGGFLGFGESEVLVVSSGPANVEEGDEVEVTGTVSEFTTDVDVDLEDADFTIEEGDAYLEATSVNPVTDENGEPADGDETPADGGDETPVDGGDETPVDGGDETPTGG